VGSYFAGPVIWAWRMLSAAVRKNEAFAAMSVAE